MGWAAAEFGTAGQFFNDYFVVNYCPLIFLEETVRNRTPDKIPASEMAVVEAACDEHLKRVIEVLDPAWLIGVGGFAEARLREVAGDRPDTRIIRILHPESRQSRRQPRLGRCGESNDAGRRIALTPPGFCRWNAPDSFLHEFTSDWHL